MDSLSKVKEWFRRHRFVLLQTSSAILGLICGFTLRYTVTISPLAKTYLQLPGQLMVKYCSMFVVPLIVVSLASSLGTIKREGNNRLISLTFILIITLSSFISIFGLIMVCLVNPGSGGNFGNSPIITRPKLEEKTRSREDSVYDIVMNLIPNNIIGATFMMEYTAKTPIDPQNITMGYRKETEQSFKTNILGLCVFALILGFSFLHLGDRVKTVKQLLDETNVLIMRILQTFIVVMPICMFFWMVDAAINIQSPTAVLKQLAWFSLTAFISFAFIWIVVYPGIYFFSVRKNPFRLYSEIMPALVVASGSASSSITLPVTMKSMEENHKLPKLISNFVLPLCMNLHMPGTSVYYPMMVMFVAQMRGVSVSIDALVPLIIYIIILVMALPAAGGGGIVFFVMACDMINVENPMEVLIYLFYIDDVMERMRTATNVMGDCIIAAIVEKYCHLEDEEQIEESHETNIQPINENLLDVLKKSWKL